MALRQRHIAATSAKADEAMPSMDLVAGSHRPPSADRGLVAVIASAALRPSTVGCQGLEQNAQRDAAGEKRGQVRAWPLKRQSQQIVVDLRTRRYWSLSPDQKSTSRPEDISCF